ncbi:iron permease [Gordoniibacillus kamchatkensis]|uniref:Iron permease n=1 Tax=Gordoniibacillus kamchatkensis TaxID=1590651 RepID=A0ABR5AHI2_9BACL|nr:iron permease [Paenibacillus sp. VKM B-2647]
MRILLGIVILCSFVPAASAATAEDALKQANASVRQALEAAQQGNYAEAVNKIGQFRDAWLDFEDGIKKHSKTAYRLIEESMSDVSFLLAQQPVQQEKLTAALRLLLERNEHAIAGDYGYFKQSEAQGGGNATVASLVALLDDASAKLASHDTEGAKADMESFKKSWLDIEGVVLTQSAGVYGDAERDMVSAYGLIASTPPKTDEAAKIIAQMRAYLAPLAGKTTYTMFDATTILLREGLEALLVVVALLAFLKKAGHDNKKAWIWYGVGAGLLVSLALGVAVQLLFSSGAFGSNNFLIAGCTGLFAAVMLLYMSYWLHSKSSLSAWQTYIRSQSTKALATGSLVSLAALSFLAVFREGTETVLFFIGMASSIGLGELLAGIAIGIAVLAVLAALILFFGVRIPVRPFFLVSSVLVFYLCFKFTGMGVHGLQLAGWLPASHVDGVPTLTALALYPTWQNLVPQAALLICALAAVAYRALKDRQWRKSETASTP